METTDGSNAVRLWGIAFVVFAIGFNVPYTLLGLNFDYPAILRHPPGEVLTAFAAGGTPLILTWALFALAALLLAPIAIGMSRVTRRDGSQSPEVAVLGIAAGITQAIGLLRWVYAVPGIAAAWVAAANTDTSLQQANAAVFTALHQFAGVGIGEAIGQSLTGFWLIGVSLGQRKHPRFGGAVAALGIVTGVILLLGIVEGLATVIPFDPSIFGLAALVGFLLLTLWLIWTGLLCILRPAVMA